MIKSSNFGAIIIINIGMEEESDFQHRPDYQISTHTDSQAQWIIPMPSMGLN